MEQEGRVIPVAIEDEIKESYLNYAMSVIVSRALPDARDGLKPVHRRILYSMSEMGLRYNQPFKKSGRIVGDVLGKFHPHGDQSIYDALVRLAQDFSLRYPLIDGQGNFGSPDDAPAAMRYTEARLTRLAEELLSDIKKETVNFGSNYDDSMKEPLVLPAALPQLLINGASGIAVGMATNLPPHNLNEVNAAINAYIDTPEITIDELMEHVKGPDFPGGGIIFGRRGISQAYKTGRGKITVRAKVDLEVSKTGRDVIVITELPYNVVNESLIERISDLVRNGKINGISFLNDESDRNGLRIVIELKNSALPKLVLNQLFAHTAMQQNFNVNALALVKGEPKLLDLKSMIKVFVEHRKEVITKRIEFDLRQAQEKEHILKGLKIALDNIDQVIKIIRGSENVKIANAALQDNFKLSQKQTQAILDMRLQKLTSLETKKIIDELKELEKLIARLQDILAHEEKIFNIIKQEARENTKKYGDERRTRILADEVEKIDIEDLIKKEDMVVLISNQGFIKRVPATAYRSQGRGGKGSMSAKLKNEDFLEHLFIASTHEYILFVSSAGKAYWVKVYEIPEGSRTSRGSQIKTLLNITPNEEVTEIVSIPDFEADRFLFMATRGGIVKRVKLSDFANAKTRGIIAINLEDGDRLVSSLLTNGDNEVVLVSKYGQALRFNEQQVRAMGRATRGVTGLRFKGGDELTGLMVIKDNEEMFLVSQNGYGKRVNFDLIMPHGRSTFGQVVFKHTERNGELIGALTISQKDEIVCITSQGNTIRLQAASVPLLGRQAQGVRVLNIGKPDYLIGSARLIKEEEE